MNKQELTEFIDRITQGRKLPIEIYNAKRIQDSEMNLCVDVINVELDVCGDEYEFHFCTDLLVEWAVSESMLKYEFMGNEREMSRTHWIDMTEDEDLINTVGMFLNEIR